MTKTENKTASAAVKGILACNPDGLPEIIRVMMQEVLETEMEQALGASKSERTSERLSYRPGYYGRTLITRVGKLELRVPQDRSGRSPRSCSSVISALNRRWFQPWRRYTSRCLHTEGEGDH
ncbi:mutator family transposase [Rhizobium azibense]|uniref:Mutator family transposase n=1 Tax=Rhizobium azibense TaxID=1136135 RepID=A0A4R3RAA7_9HYPH|nr:mutator family transposase [Rhizobium azibense]